MSIFKQNVVKTCEMKWKQYDISCIFRLCLCIFHIFRVATIYKDFIFDIYIYMCVYIYLYINNWYSIIYIIYIYIYIYIYVFEKC